MRFYKQGSHANVVLFHRPEGTDYVVNAGGQNFPASAEKDLYIIQWGGSATYDSGYMQYAFEDKKLAISFFKDMEAGEREYSPYSIDQHTWLSNK